MEYREERPLTVYDIGLITYQIGKALFPNGLQCKNGFIDYITSSACYDTSNISSRSLILTVKDGTARNEVYDMIGCAMRHMITSNYTTIHNILTSLGYRNPEYVYNEFIINTACMNTTLQLSETEYCIMLV